MPGRKTVLINKQYYHIFNRGVARIPIFTDIRSYKRFLEAVRFYRNCKLPISYSKFLSLNIREKNQFISNIEKHKNFHIDILSYCIMPNHFHFLLMQKKDNGISKFISDISNSYSRYINIRKNRVGPLFQGRFKSVLIESEEQLIHVSRYIHLNPFVSKIVRKATDILDYPYSSISYYMVRGNDNLINKDIIMASFKKSKKYVDFVLNNADYQKRLSEIKHLVLE